MKKLIILSIVLLLTACDAQVSDASSNYELPDDLKECKVIELRPKGTSLTKKLYLIKCPEGYIGNVFGYANNPKV